MIFLKRSRQASCDVQRCLRLPQAADIITLTFNREQTNIANGGWIDQLAAIVEFAPGQQMALEHGINGLQIELRSHVAHCPIFVVKFLLPIRTFAVAYDKVGEHGPMAHHVVA